MEDESKEICPIGCFFMTIIILTISILMFASVLVISLALMGFTIKDLA